jgi:hypothetical protein
MKSKTAKDRRRTPQPRADNSKAAVQASRALPIALCGSGKLLGNLESATKQISKTVQRSVEKTIVKL